MSGPWPSATVTAGSTITIPAGVELEVSSTITVQAGVTINGPGTIRLVSGGSFKAAGNDVSFGNVTIVSDAPRNLLATITSGAYTGWSFTDTVFDNVALDMTAVGRTEADGSTATTGTGITGTITDTEHKNYAGNYAIELGGVNGVVVARAHVHDNGVDVDEGDGIKVLAGSINVEVVDCILERNTRDGIDIYDASATTIDGCTIRNNGALGIDSKWATTDANPNGSNVITNNTVTGNGSGINASTDGNTVTGNTVTANGSFGIRIGAAADDGVTGTTGGSVSGNTVTGGHDNGIILGTGTTGVTIDANTVTGNVINIALAAGTTSGCTVTDNIAEPASPADDTNEIRLRTADHTVSGNTGTVTNV